MTALDEANASAAQREEEEVFTDRIIKAFFSVLNDRGFDNWWDAIDKETQDEIEEILHERVMEAICAPLDNASGKAETRECSECRRTFDTPEEYRAHMDGHGDGGEDRE